MRLILTQNQCHFCGYDAHCLGRVHGGLVKWFAIYNLSTGSGPLLQGTATVLCNKRHVPVLTLTSGKRSMIPSGWQKVPGIDRGLDLPHGPDHITVADGEA